MKGLWGQSALCPCPTGDKAMTQSNYEVDIATYAKIEQKEQEITLVWEESRDVFMLVVKCSNPSSLSNARLQYWQHHWPHRRIPKGAVVGAGGSGWMAQDDWFNGGWKDADANVRVEGNNAIYTFNPINAKEFPDMEDFDAVYRRTLKLRLVFDGKRPEVQKVEAYSDSVWRDTEVRIEWGDEFSCQGWQGNILVYNGDLLEIEPITENVEASANSGIKSDGKKGSIKAKLRFAYNEDVNSFDKTVATMHTTARSFSFLIDEIEAGERIFVKDFDILVTKAADNISYESFRKEWEADHRASLYDRIKELPEQTFEKAWNDMPEKNSRGFMPLGCDGGRQKFGVGENGDVFCPKNWIPRVRGRDTDRLLWEGRQIRYTFGFPDVKPTERHLEDGYLPIIYGKWEADSVVYEQSAFATLLGADILSGERMQGDDPTVLLAKVTLTNRSAGKKISLKLNSRCDAQETLEIADGFVFATNYQPKRMRYYMETSRGDFIPGDDGLVYEVELGEGESHTIYFKIPFITLSEEDEFDLVKNADYEAESDRVKEFWRKRISEGSQIVTPNENLNDFYRAHLSHMLVTDDREVGSDRYVSRVGTFPYGAFANESCMCISDFSRRGYKKEAEERLELFVHHQSTVPLPGNFTHIDGLYYGAGGYECGGYNQHHGWVLWALGEHYWYYRDKEWLNRVAPSMVKACDWIIDQRKNTKQLDKDGKKVLEYGFLPAGALEDVQEYYYWLSTNAHTCWGFKNAAEALADVGHPDSERLVKEADQYKEDLVRGFRESMIRSPVVKLLDGTYVPHVPSRLYRRGRGFGWIRETLEGAIYLVRCGIFDPRDEVSTWIIKDFEDNLYISDRYGYSVEDFERDWFSLGGFSMQSNLLCHPVPYMFRDEQKHFLRGYFNAFASVFYPDIRALVEHALPTLADNNGVWFKPSDEAQSAFWLRLMFIYESGNELNLALATPREWLEHGKSIKIERAMTYFGEMGYEIHSEAGDGKIRMVLNPPTRNAPEAINVRFRHPQGKHIVKVLVNGREWTDFDAKKELVRLGGTTEKTEIVALY